MADRVEFKLTGLDGVLEMLQNLPAEVVSKRGGPVKLALKKGANVLRKQAAENLKRSLSNTDAAGQLHSTGLLSTKLITSRGKAPTSGKGERYLVRVKRETYPNRSGKGKSTTVENAARLEYGTEKQPAEPWLRPAFAAKRGEAVAVIEADLKKRVDLIAQKMLNQAKGR